MILFINQSTVKRVSPVSVDDLERAFSCPAFDGLFPNPEDCHTFYYCVGGEAILEVRVMVVCNSISFCLYTVTFIYRELDLP